MIEFNNISPTLQNERYLLGSSGCLSACSAPALLQITRQLGSEDSPSVSCYVWTALFKYHFDINILFPHLVWHLETNQSSPVTTPSLPSSQKEGGWEECSQRNIKCLSHNRNNLTSLRVGVIIWIVVWETLNSDLYWTQLVLLMKQRDSSQYKSYNANQWACSVSI